MSATSDKIRDAMNKMNKLLETAETEKRDLTAEEETVFNSLDAEVKNLKVTAEREQKIQAIRDSLDTPANPAASRVDLGNDRNGKKPWNCFGEFLLAVKNAYDPSHPVIDNRLIADRGSDPQNSTGMSVAVSSDGGFMVQKQFVTKLMDSIAKQSSVLSRITRIPIGEGQNGIVMPALSETSRADGSRFGGVRAYWANEGGTATANKPQIREITLKLEKLLAFAYMTEELMRDATAMEAFVNKAYSDEMSFKLDDAIFNGTGKGQPLGIINGSALISVVKETGQAADTVVWENIVKMWSRLAPYNRANCAWFINQEVEAQLMTMTQVVGTGGVPVYLPAGGASSSPYGALMGRPVVPCEQAAKLGDVGDIILADMSDYIGIDKGGLETDTSIHLQFLYDEQVFRFRYRFNGCPYTNAVVQSYKNSSHTISPYVAIAAR